MEAIVRPLTWADWPGDARNIFQAFRSPAGDDLVSSDDFYTGTRAAACGGTTTVIDFVEA